MPALVKPNATQRARLDQSRSAWQPPGTSIQIHGRTIPGGMLYVGSNVTGLYNGCPVEPALIDPKSKTRDRFRYAYPYQNNYWQTPSYHNLSPIDRAGYLDWLAAGRPSETLIYEYALLFLYGIERRIFFDARFDENALNEIPALLDEVDRIVHGFGHSSYAQLRIAAANLRAAAESRLPGFDPTALDPPMKHDGWSMPLALEIALGTFAKEHRPLPPRWAYSWAVCSPYAHLPTVERHCPDEFAEYFSIEYHRTFGEGILLPDRDYGNALTYRPMSPSFQRPIQVGIERLLALGLSSSVNSALAALVRRVSDDLAPFARAVGAYGSQTPLSAYGLLPERMAGSSVETRRMAPLTATLSTALEGRSSVLVEKASLLAFFPEVVAGPTPTQATGISNLLQRLGYGIEPDPARMRTPFLRAESVGVYRIEFGPDNYYENRDLSGEMALLGMWSYIAASDGPIHDRTAASACAILVSQADLQPFEINRLHAHAAWRAKQPANLNYAKRRFELATSIDIPTCAQTIMAMALIDTTPSPARIKALTKIYSVLGLTGDRVHADIHRVTTQQRHPVQIIEGEPTAGFGIPTAPDAHAITLDSSRVATVRAETDAISTLLHGVFGDEQSGGNATATPEQASGSHDSYTRLLEQLATRPAWPMTELTALAASTGLMAAGAIETLNDRALALGLEPLLDCDGDICDCYEPTLKELLAHG